MSTAIAYLIVSGFVLTSLFIVLYAIFEMNLRNPVSLWVVLLNVICVIVLGNSTLRFFFGISHQWVSLAATIMVNILLLGQFWILWTVARMRRARRREPSGRERQS